MNNLEKLFYLNKILLNEMPQHKEQAEKFEKDYQSQRKLLRSLMNVSPPSLVNKKFLHLQDEFLKDEVIKKGIVEISQLIPSKSNNQIYLWQGDITTLKVDAIVNAANSALLGCFIPCHGCIDNAIHSTAGLQLRQECNEIMQKQGKEEKTGKAKITSGYNLPCKCVIHTVGPIITGELTENDCTLLRNCYINCLKLAIENNLKSIAFCCISTGEFCFPNEKASEIAINTVNEFLNETKSEIEVIFNVFKKQDYNIYQRLLGKN